MNSLNQYDIAAAQFYSKMSIKGLPISSWEFYIDSLEKLKVYGKDLNILKEMSTVWKNNWDFNHELIQKESVIIITDTQLKIVYASINIKKMTGYNPKELLGNSPKIFQGEKTDKITSKRIRKAIQNEEAFKAELINYKKNGNEYLCSIEGFPIYNKEDNLINFIAFEKVI